MASKEKTAYQLKIAGVILLSVLILLTLAYTAVELVAVMDENKALEQQQAAQGAGVVVDTAWREVRITYPTSMLASLAGDKTPEEYLQALRTQEGVKSVEENAGGTITLTVDKQSYNQMVEAVHAEIVDVRLYNLVWSVDTPSIMGASFAGDLSEYSIEVGRYAFENGGDKLAVEPLAIYSLYYQSLLGYEQPRVEIVFVDTTTQETIETLVYPAG